MSMDFFKKLELAAYVALAVIVVIAGIIYYDTSKSTEPVTSAETEQTAETPEAAASTASESQTNPFNL